MEEFTDMDKGFLINRVRTAEQNAQLDQVTEILQNAIDQNNKLINESNYARLAGPKSNYVRHSFHRGTGNHNVNTGCNQGEKKQESKVSSVQDETR